MYSKSYLLNLCAIESFWSKQEMSNYWETLGETESLTASQ